MKTGSKIISLLLAVIILLSAGNLAVEAATIKVSTTAKLVAETTSDSVELRWRKVSKATGYKVYQRVDGKWKSIKSVKTNKIVIDELTASEKYTFAVRTYRKYDGKTYYSSYKSITATTDKMSKPSAPKAAKITKNSITLSWDEVEGATGYRVYQYKGGKWVKIKSTTSEKYTVKSLKSGTSYKFRIKPYAKTSSGTKFGSDSKSVTVKTYYSSKAKITSAKPTVTTVALKWDKLSGATGYRVCVLKNGEWSKVTSTSSTKYTVKKLKADTKYTFMVWAYKKVDGVVSWYSYSDSKSVTTKKAATEKPDEPTTGPSTTEPSTTEPSTTESTTKPTTTKPTTTKPTTTKPTTTKPTTTKPTTTKPTTTKPTTTKPTTTKPTTTKPTTTKPTTTKPTTTKPTTTKPTTTKPTTTKPTTTKPTTTKPTTTRPTTTQPTTNPAYELRAFRIEKYKEIFERDTVYFKISSDNGDGGKANMEYAQKNGNIYVNATDDGINAKLYFEKKTNKMFAYFLMFYYEIPENEWEEMNITEPLDEMKVQNLGSFINVSEEVFDGKKVICESYIDTKYGFIVKYYFDGETLVGIEKFYKNESKQIIYVHEVKNTVSDSLLARPTSGYVNVSGLA